MTFLPLLYNFPKNLPTKLSYDFNFLQLSYEYPTTFLQLPYEIPTACLQHMMSGFQLLKFQKQAKQTQDLCCRNQTLPKLNVISYAHL